MENKNQTVETLTSDLNVRVISFINFTTNRKLAKYSQAKSVTSAGLLAIAADMKSSIIPMNALGMKPV